MSFEAKIFLVVIYLCGGLCGMGVFMMIITGIRALFMPDPDIGTDDHENERLQTLQLKTFKQREIIIDNKPSILTDADRKRYEKQIKVRSGKDLW